MLYKQKFDTFIRRYCDIGYITSKSDFGDRVVDASGAVFLKALSRKGQSLDALAETIVQSFIGVGRDGLKKDFPKCLQCADKSFCAMCIVCNANENPDGDPLKINGHFCRVAALNRKIVLDWKEKLQVAQ
jgi:hypothetical protein